MEAYGTPLNATSVMLEGNTFIGELKKCDYLNTSLLIFSFKSVQSERGEYLTEVDDTSGLNALKGLLKALRLSHVISRCEAYLAYGEEKALLHDFVTNLLD